MQKYFLLGENWEKKIKLASGKENWRAAQTVEMIFILYELLKGRKL